MKFNYTKAYSAAGAQMGRPGSTQQADSVTWINIEQVPIHEGYDPGGAYWGCGEPLFVAWGDGDDEEQVAFIRAANWSEARIRFKEIFPNAEEIPSINEFLTAYIEAALWSTSDDEEADRGEFLDEYFGFEDLAPETLQEMQEDCQKFLTENQEDIGDRQRRAGHDFWLTRNGHGCGFWDGDWPEEVGARLTASSKLFGEVYLYVGDDGKIYQG